MGIRNTGWTLTFSSSCVVLGVLGIGWSEWFLIAGAVVAASAAAFVATEPGPAGRG